MNHFFIIVTSPALKIKHQDVFLIVDLYKILLFYVILLSGRLSLKFIQTETSWSFAKKKDKLEE